MSRAIFAAAVDPLLGEPEGASDASWLRALRLGSPALRVRAIRAIGEPAQAGVYERLLSLLHDGVPGVRRAAATRLGQGTAAEGTRGEAVAEALASAASVEAQDEVRLAMAGAAARRGWPVAKAWAILLAGVHRVLPTAYGLRDLSLAVGLGPTVWAARWRLLLHPPALSPGSERTSPDAVVPLPALLICAGLRERLRRDPADRAAQEALGAQQQPGDLNFFLGRLHQSGRRERHAISVALGYHGDPRAVPALLGVLRAMDDDPGHGFTARREAGLALGRMGLPSLGSALIQALTDEALEHEGRPGAGLGVQFPVRSALLYALGETGDPAVVPALGAYLGNTHGSALGGFYLPAMDALVRLREPGPLLPLLAADELVVANTIGALAGMGAFESIRPLLEDRRPAVASAAALALAGRSGATVGRGGVTKT